MATQRRVGARAITAITLSTALGLAISACSSGASSGGSSTSPSSSPSSSPTSSTSSSSSSGASGDGSAVVSRLGAAVELKARTTQVPGADPASLATAEQAFSLALLAKSASGAANTTVSPASLAAVLSMLQQGARGQTAEQIAAALHMAGMTAAAQGAAWHALTTSWASAAAAGHISLDTANSLWQQRGVQLDPGFLTALANYYDAGVWQVDFEGDMPAALAAINQWTSTNTHGKIGKLFDSLPPQTQLVLADAVYFKAAWQEPFEGAQTKPGRFTTATGSMVQTPFMNATQLLPAASTADYEAVELPYRGGRFSALAIMPNRGSLADFLAGLTSQKLADVVSSLSTGNVTLSMPKFQTESTLNLNNVLQELGIRAAFTDAADFSGISPTTSLKIDEVLQRTYLKVAEKGTEAAAATGSVMVPTAMPAQGTEIVLDHPFLFLIRDNTTGALLFASEINNPSA